jgi:hypothetical protein
VYSIFYIIYKNKYNLYVIYFICLYGYEIKIYLKVERQMSVENYFKGKNGPSSGINMGRSIIPTYTGYTGYTGVSNNTSSKVTDYLKQGLAYLVGIAIIIFIIMLFIHFFITPIFSAQPGAPGIVTLPGLDSGVLFWNKSSPQMIPNSALPIQNMEYGYSFIMDIFVINPHVHFSTHPRILFRRGGTLRQTPTGNTLAGIIENYNIVGALLPDANDLIISVLNTSNHPENVIISNVPVQEPFRLGVVLMNQALEVYINGHLMKTRAFSAPPKSVKGNFYPLSGTETPLAKLQNFKVWPSILSSPEIRYAKPDMPSASEIGSNMPQTSMCPSSSNDSTTTNSTTGNTVTNRTKRGKAFITTMG